MLCPTSEITGTIIKVDFLIQSLLKTNSVSLLPFLELPQNDIIFALNCNDLKKKNIISVTVPSFHIIVVGECEHLRIT